MPAVVVGVPGPYGSLAAVWTDDTAGINAVVDLSGRARPSPDRPGGGAGGFPAYPYPR